MTLTVRAYAKLNLTLEIVGRRSDGYHEIASVLQTLSLADLLTFREASYLSLECSETSLQEESNLVLQAARLLQSHTGCTNGATITLEKAIPVASGLGGGSADAAATLWALDNVWGLGLAEEELLRLAASLGSDVPFFLRGGTALAQGRGERITVLPPAPEAWFLVVYPRLELLNKTAALYRLLQQQHWTQGRATQQLAEALSRGAAVQEAFLYNAFDSVAPTAYPDISRWRRRLLEAAPARPHLVGAGPSLYIPLQSEAHGHEVTRRLPEGEADIFILRTVPGARDILVAP